MAEVAAPIQPTQSAPVQAPPTGNGESPPPRSLRPGSLIDIKV